MPIRIAYCTNVRLPSERAHGHQIAQVCDALVALGHEVTVFATIRKETVQEPFASYYGVSDTIQLKHIGHSYHIPNWPPLRPLRLYLQNRGLKRDYQTELQPGRFDLLYTRAPVLLPTLIATGIPVILELHSLPRRSIRLFVRDCERCALVACLTSPMRDALVEWGVPREKIIVEGDAVDLARFERLPSKEASRDAARLKTDRIVVGYVGRLKTLFMEKGVKHLLEALKELQSEKRFFGFIVGGPEGDRKAYEAMARSIGLTDDDVRFVGEVPAHDVPAMLAACDVLAMPFPDLPHYRHHMSPLKMFEYMAADRPIVTTDLPTIRDVLSEETAFFCKPGDAGDLARVLRDIAADAADGLKRSANARALVERHTWKKRMGRILDGAFRNRT